MVHEVVKEMVNEMMYMSDMVDVVTFMTLLYLFKDQ